MIETPTLDLSVPELIRLHGDVTDKLAQLKHKLDLLTALRTGITDEPDISEDWIRDAIGQYERMQGKIAAQLGWA